MRNERYGAVFAACMFIASLPIACGNGRDEPKGGEGGALGGEAGDDDEADPFTARCKRLFQRATPALDDCLDESLFIERFCVESIPYPYCVAYADAMLACYETHGIPEDFVCWMGLPSLNVKEGSPCWDEYTVLSMMGCV